VLALFSRIDKIPQIERQAGRIEDPVARLRFLRGAMSEERRRKAANHPSARRAGWVLLAVTLVLAPLSRPKGAAGSFERERGPMVPRAAAPAATTPASAAPIPHVWRVEQSGTGELYSNGLRIDLSFKISNRPRAAYPIFGLNGASAIAKTGRTPVGIVFHTTESLIAPFEEDQNRRLRQLGRNVIDVIRTERAYHYVIDRFGRVFAAVAESDAANHAGNSVWAGADGIYVNLNDSFLGIAFEAQTDAAEAVTPAQITSGKALTEMLRSRYKIEAGNCVTHAQVSVNPLNMRIGAHTDWASDFPFAAVGLPNNYRIAPASMYAFGFEADEVFERVTGGRWPGLNLAEDRIAKQAAVENMPVARYRAALKHRYRDIATALKGAEAEEVAK
jgi:N-acetylmuramoyl-L-alanine amidase